MECPSRALPWEICLRASKLAPLEGGDDAWAEVSRGHSSDVAPSRRAKHEEPSASPRSMPERDADTKAGMPSRTQTARRGTVGGTGTARQTGTAPGDSGGDEALTLIEQVVRRENLVAAHARVVC